jgi:hypothetical protein
LRIGRIKCWASMVEYGPDQSLLQYPKISI